MHAASPKSPVAEISQLAAAEKQLVISRLMARMAHEIRNPLSSLDIHVQLLDEDLKQLNPPISQATTGRLEIIRGELHRLEDLVQRFLRLADPTALSLTRLDLAVVLRKVCDLLGPEAASRQIELALSLPPNLPEMFADAGQLTQAMVNLVLNAIQAVDRGGRVELDAQLEQGGNGVQIEVRDSGPGVPPDRQASIFDPFYTTKRPGRGTGLGLSICKSVMKEHSGSVEAANAPDGGAMFTVTLPVSGGS